MSKFVFDIEVFPNLFSVIFYDGEQVKEFSIYSEKNQIRELVKFIKESNLTLIGYNNAFYDDVILNYMLNSSSILVEDTAEINRRLYSLSTKTIDIDNQDRKTQKGIRDLRKSRFFKSIDLMKVGGIMKSLKLTAVALKHHRIQDLPYPFDKVLTLDEIHKVLEYNFNDVDITWKLYKVLEDKIKLRELLAEKWNIPSIISESDSGIGNKWLDKTYADITGMDYYDFKDLRTKHDSILIADCIFDSVVFQTKEFKEFLEEFKKIEYYTFKADSKAKIPLIEVNGLKIQCGFGGLHTEDEPRILDCTTKKVVDKDVGSQYPTNIINNRILAEHLDIRLLDEYKGVRDRRIEIKFIEIVEQEGLKLVINAFFGKYGFDGSYLKDDKAMLKVTINNQMFILMLIEELLMNKFEVVSINTDGFVTRVEHDKVREELFQTICSTWERNTKFDLEEVEYDLFIQRDINNYISRTTKGKVKQKGIFETNKPVNKGFDKPIVAIALNKYFLEGIPVEQTIRNHEDIYDFCMAKKVGNLTIA